MGHSGHFMTNKNVVLSNIDLEALHEKQKCSYFNYGFGEYWVAKWKKFLKF